MSIETLQEEAVALLKGLIKIPSFSGQEAETGDLIGAHLASKNIGFKRKHNNIIARNLHFDPDKPNILLNSHHDTVKVVNGWKYDPHGAEEHDGVIYGLGSNDAGASLVSLIATFIHFSKEEKLPFNLILAATAEEENFGPLGVKSLLENELSEIDLGIVGEPTEMNLAIAEKGLLVIDAEAKGTSGHAAREEGENAIYKAIKDVELISKFEYDQVSDLLGPNVITVTQIQAGYQHNVVPDSCKFVIDLRVNEKYSLKEAFDIIDQQTQSDLKARSFNNNPSGISVEHPIVKRGISLGRMTYGSPTLSDQAHMKFPSIKIGPGKSERSHTANEHILVSEIHDGIEIYIELLKDLKI